jgi:hypothetical protein
MPIVKILVVLVVCGAILGGFNRFVDIDARFKWAVNVIACIACLVWLLKVFGLWNGSGLF